jgi:septal ring factor EnvC (AmiA/AmiB activator)
VIVTRGARWPWPALGAIILAASVVGAQDSERGPDRATRLRAMQAEIARLETETSRLARRERGVLGELERVRSELRLHEARLAEVELRLESVDRGIEMRNVRVAELHSGQAERRAYLAVRVAQLYREGPSRMARIAIGGRDVEAYLGGLRYAAWLGARDSRVLAEFRVAESRLVEERRSLELESFRLDAVRDELAGAHESLQGARARQGRLLAELREDRVRREAAAGELRAAAEALNAVVDARAVVTAATRPDLARFRGLLDPPLEGRVLEGFGDVIHPRFKTRVPHPGIDFAADEGTPFRALFEGRVLYAAWLRGYGLTAILDHGHGAVSVYAHASALMVEEGEEVLGGQKLGYVGETGSLKGPYLYFELRIDGRPVDPAPWLRP